MELLQKIYNNLEYYGGYVTRRIIGNLSLNSSTPAEQNHSSIVAFNGEVMLGTIIVHVKSLLERQQQLSNKEKGFKSDYIVRSHRYKPVLDGEFACEEIKARKVIPMQHIKLIL